MYIHWRAGENVNRVLLLEPSHFKKFPVSEKVLQFILNLSKNSAGTHLYIGEIDDLAFGNGIIISKEHPLFSHFPGIKDSREWMFPEVTGYHNSFFLYWKKCKKYLKDPSKKSDTEVNEN